MNGYGERGQEPDKYYQFAIDALSGNESIGVTGYYPPFVESVGSDSPGAIVEDIADSFDEITDEATQVVGEIVDSAKEITEEARGKLRKIGGFVLSMPRKIGEVINDASLRAYVAVEANPKGAAVTAATVTAASAALVFQQSPGNESARVEFGTDILINTQNKVYVGLGVAALTTLIEGGSSFFIALGLRKEGGFVNRTAEKIVKKKDVKEKPEKEAKEPRTIVGRAVNYTADKISNIGVMDKLANASLMLGMGAGIYASKKHFQSEEPSFKEDLKNSARGTAVIAGASGMAGYLIAGGLSEAEKVGLGGPAEFFANNVLDWKFWTGLYAAGVAVKLTKKGALGSYRFVKNKLVHQPSHLMTVQVPAIDGAEL